MKVDVSFLIGRHFATASNNVCTFQQIEIGALRANWKTPPTESDKLECERWVASILDATAWVSSGKQNEAAALAVFREIAG